MRPHASTGADAYGELAPGLERIGHVWKRREVDVEESAGRHSGDGAAITGEMRLVGVPGGAGQRGQRTPTRPTQFRLCEKALESHDSRQLSGSVAEALKDAPMELAWGEPDRQCQALLRRDSRCGNVLQHGFNKWVASATWILFDAVGDEVFKSFSDAIHGLRARQSFGEACGFVTVETVQIPQPNTTIRNRRGVDTKHDRAISGAKSDSRRLRSSRKRKTPRRGLRSAQPEISPEVEIAIGISRCSGAELADPQQIHTAIRNKQMLAGGLCGPSAGDDATQRVLSLHWPVPRLHGPMTSPAQD